jgi:hypothetical protein
MSAVKLVEGRLPLAQTAVAGSRLGIQVTATGGCESLANSSMIGAVWAARVDVLDALVAHEHRFV